jgi:hypothetical protein
MKNSLFPASRPARILPAISVCSLLVTAILLGQGTAFAQDHSFAAANNVVWTTLGQDENDSMPIGNGDLAANVWTEKNGDLVLLVAKADAWTEQGKLVKLGRVRIQLTPNPFTTVSDFSQTLRLADGSIQIVSGQNTLRVWVDANHPVLHVEAKLDQPATLQAKLELWRTRRHPFNEPSPDKGGLFEFGNISLPLDFEADTVLPAGKAQVTWLHFNRQSVYPIVLQQEHLESLKSKYPDPLLHRCFGAVLTGQGLVAVDGHTLRSAAASRNLRIDITALTTTQTASPAAWKAKLDATLQQLSATLPDAAWQQHQQWWRAFWDRSWIHIAGSDEAARVSQGYILQRYMMAASSRGAYPAKYNGSLFTVGHDLPEGVVSTPRSHSPDFRQWGNSFWNQNTRQLYWPLLATGDFDLLKPWFDMYTKALPLATDRTRIYFHHAGAAFIETINFWGLPNLNDFGWDNPTYEVTSRWMRYHVQGGLEVTAQMLDRYAVTQDAAFARTTLVPFADAILTYYAQHWTVDEYGKIHFSPAQAIETYQLDAVNPAPDIAGLMSVLPRLLDLPADLTTPEQRAAWKKLESQLPPLPKGKTANGKLPRQGLGDGAGKPVLLPAERYGLSKNVENPELYAVFPYRIYGVGKPDLTMARDTFSARLFPYDTCWGQDGEEAALLGLTQDARKSVVDEFTAYGPQRFRWFWRMGSDWIPDLDNGGAGMSTLQLMLMQTDGRRIQLLPAWPKEWTADFKLHAPLRTTVEGHVENGRVTSLTVTPESRAKDVVVLQ